MKTRVGRHAMATLMLSGMVCLISACIRNSETPQDPAVDWQGKLTNGMSRELVLEVLGEPTVRDQWGEGFEEFIYVAPLSSSAPRIEDAGVAITFSNNQIVAFAPITRIVGHTDWEASPVQKKRATGERFDKPAHGQECVEVFVLHQEDAAGRTYINTAEMPMLGYIDAEPAVLICRVRDVQLKELPVLRDRSKPMTDSAGGAMIWLAVAPGEAKQLYELSLKNAGRLLLLKHRGEPLVELAITAPLEGPELNLVCMDSRHARKVYEALAGLVSSDK